MPRWWAKPTRIPKYPGKRTRSARRSARLPRSLSRSSTRWSVSSALAFAAAILGAGAAFAADATLVPALGRLFLDGIRAQAEARQCALALFVEREVFRARDRCAVLMLVTRFKRVAVILPDAGLAQYAPPAELDRIARAMRDALVTKGAPAAFESAFTRSKRWSRLAASSRIRRARTPWGAD